jgi:uncharacterized protein (DUF1501 family)
MKVTRREIVRGGIATFTLGCVAPALLTDMASAQTATQRNTVVIDLAGGVDGLSVLVPYQDPYYYGRRPPLAVPAADVLPIGQDAAKRVLGLHPRLAGVKSLYDQGKVAILPRVGYADGSRSHFSGADIWATADPTNRTRFGWLGRYLDSLAPPLDPLYAWNTTATTPRLLQAPITPVATLPNVGDYFYRNQGAGSEGVFERAAAARIASHVPVNQPHLALVQRSMAGALATVDRVRGVGEYAPSTGVTYPGDGFGSALKLIAGAIVQQAGTKLFLLRLGGFDTHAAQGTNRGVLFDLLGTLNDGIAAFYQDLKNQGVINDTLIMTISEFGRRIAGNSGSGSDHGAANTMLVLGGSVRGGLYGTAADLNPYPENTTLESDGADVRYETDFRTLYATVADRWLMTDSVALLQGSFRDTKLGFLG